jgi:hypothetical protein
MGYLSNAVITIDAILTKKGRELLAKGDGSFKITQFALADDEINYNLYNTSHPSGSSYYGQAIENMPLLEAFPDEAQIMKYRLVTLPRGTSKLPVINLGYEAITLKQGASLSITPQTLNYLGEGQLYESQGYSATIGDVRILNSMSSSGLDPAQEIRFNPERSIIERRSSIENVTLGTNVSRTLTGTSFTLRATTVNTLFGEKSTLNTIFTVIGRDSGARITIPITITKI